MLCCMQSWLGIESSEATCNARGMAEATQGCPRIAPGRQPALWPRLRHGGSIGPTPWPIASARLGPAEPERRPGRRLPSAAKHPVRADAPSQRAIDHHNATKNPMVKPAHARGSHFRGKWTCARSDVRSRRQQIRALACPATRQGRSIWRRSRIRGSRPNSRRGHLDHLIAQVGDHGEDLIEALPEEFRHLIRPAS